MRVHFFGRSMRLGSRERDCAIAQDGLTPGKFVQHTVFFPEVLNDILLLLLYPSRGKSGAVERDPESCALAETTAFAPFHTRQMPSEASELTACIFERIEYLDTTSSRLRRAVRAIRMIVRSATMQLESFRTVEFQKKKACIWGIA